MIRTTRIKTYSPGDIVSATDLNAIQDHIVDTANVVNRLATLSSAESIWVDRTLAEGSATQPPVTGHGFVKLQAGGQVGRLRLPGVPEGLALHVVRIQCYIPAGEVAFTLWQTTASPAAGVDLFTSDSQVPGWETVIPTAPDREAWGTVELTGTPMSAKSDVTLWVLVENRHQPGSEWNSLILSSLQGIWG